MISSQNRTVKKHNAFLVALNVLFAASLACSLGTGSSTVPPASSQEPSSQPSANSTTVVPNRNSQVLGDLGSIAYTLDTDRQVSGTFDINTGKDLILTVADANGYGWMLSIPADALLSNQTITMTPFASMDVSQSGAKIISGVQLKPDGLQFLDAVRLSVTAPIDNPGVSLIFSFNQDGSEVAFAPTTNTSGGKTAIATIWHFSAAGYTNLSKSSDEYYQYLTKMAQIEYWKAIDAAKQFLKNPPKPPAPPMVSMFCRGTEVNPEQGEVYEFTKSFYGPYEDIVFRLISAIKAVNLTSDFDTSEGVAWVASVLLKAEQTLAEWGRQAVKDKPPDRLFALVRTGLKVLKSAQLAGGTYYDTDFMLTLTYWQEVLRDYYLNELKTKHDYRAFPILMTLEKGVALLGGKDRTADIMSAMTFEVIVDTSFDSTWYSGEKLFATGNVVQNADVKDLKNELTPPNLLWGTGNNMILKAKSGNFKDSTGSYPLAGLSDTGSLWLLNWDGCVTKSFDVMVSGLHGDGQNKSGTVAGASFDVSFKPYWWKGAGGTFIFTIPMQNLSPALGDGSFSGSGSAADGDFTSSGKIHIAIKHTPK